MVMEDTMHSLQGGSLQYNLFGGAISVDMPRGLVDASDVRPVPDNQEVWLDESGQSVIVEVLERVKGLQDDQAVSFFFNDLADVNECKERTIDVIRAIDKGVLCDDRFAGSACSGRHEYALDGCKVLEKMIATFRVVDYGLFG